MSRYVYLEIKNKHLIPDNVVAKYKMQGFNITMEKEFKSINGLMKHIRNDASKTIEIGGSRQKKLLRLDGYYHGYKGYRFYRKADKKIEFDSYVQLHAVIEYDMALKTLFYPEIMFLETSLKNYTLEKLLETANSSKFNVIFDKLIYESDTKDNSKKNYKFKQRNNVYGKLTSAYMHSSMIQHFYNKDNYVPIWAIFEILTMGDFANLLSATNESFRKSLSLELRLNQPNDSNGKLLQSMIFILKDLRNAIAHNGVIFDCRFNQAFTSSRTGSAVKECLRNDIGLDCIDLNSIYDYGILVGYLLFKLDVPFTRIKRFGIGLKSIKEEIEKRVPRSISQVIIPTSANEDLKRLMNLRVYLDK